MMLLGVLIGIGISLSIYDMHWVTGGLLGGLIYTLFQTRENLTKLQKKVRQLQEKITHLQTGDQATKTKVEKSPWQQKKSTSAKTLPVKKTTTQAPKASVTPKKITQKEKSSSTFSLLFNFFKGDHGLVRIGAIILLVGISFLMKTITPLFTLTPFMKCIGIAIGGFALIGAGYWLNNKNKTYSFSLIGIGLSVLFLNAYGAYFYFGIIGYQAALFLTVTIGSLGLYLSLKYDSLPLSVLALGGGFVAPILSGVAENIPDIIVFGYYLILNLVVLTTAYYKSWRLLNILGFVSTFVLAPQWYAPENIALMQGMLITFFLIYLAVTLLYAQKEVIHDDGYVDSIITFALPFAILGFEYETLKSVEYGYAYVAAALATVYGFTAMLTSTCKNFKSMQGSLIALCAIFATLTIPLIFDPRETSTLWALEGAVAVWLGLRQNSRFTTYAGFILQAIAGCLMVKSLFVGFNSVQNVADLGLPVLNIDFFSFLIIAIAGLLTSYLYKHTPVRKTPYSITFAFWGFFWLFGSIIREVELYVFTDFDQIHVFILATSLVILTLQWLSRKLEWRMAGLPALVYTPMLIACGLSLIDKIDIHALEGLGLIAWLIAFCTHISILKLRKGDDMSITCALGLIGFLSLICWEYSLFMSHHLALDFIWMLSLWMLVFSGALWFIHNRLLGKTWPFSTYKSAYQNYALPILSVIVAFLTIRAMSETGIAMEPFYIPLLNPLELMSLLCVYVLYSRFKNPTKHTAVYTTALKGAIGVLAFVFINTVLARSLYIYNDVGYNLYHLFKDSSFLAGTSILWTVIALSMILRGSYLKHRIMWITGACLIGVVVVKLFLIDISKVDMLAKTISFMAVGLLLVGVGYFSPIPPAKKSEAVNV